MKKQKYVFTGALFICLLFLMAANLEAVPDVDLELTVETDKIVYDLNEDIIITLTARNLEDRTVELMFPTPLQMSYIMDDTYDWGEGMWVPMVVTYATLNPMGELTWDLTHSTNERLEYLPGLGTHTVVGELIGYGVTAPISFTVVPEPACLLFLSLGWWRIRMRTRQR